MPRNLEDYSDDDPIGPDGLLRDGHRLRVRMTARDGATVRGQVASRHVHDGRHSEFGLNKPGPRYNDAIDTSKIARAYEAMVRDGEERWRAGPGSQDASALGTEYAEGREGDPCTVRAGAAEGHLEGSPGHLGRVDGKLVCVPDKRRTDSMSATDAERIKQAAYDEMCRAGEQAWKNLGRS